MSAHGRVKIQTKGRFGYYTMAYSDDWGMTFTPSGIWRTLKQVDEEKLLLPHIIHTVAHESVHIALAERISLRATRAFDDIVIEDEEVSPANGVHSSHPFESRRQLTA